MIKELSMNKRFKILLLIPLILFSISFWSCKEERIPDNDMVKIFVEVFITDATVTSSKLSIKYAKRDTIEYYRPIYSKMGYSDEQFNTTIDYYLEHLDELDKVLDKVVNELSRLETEKNPRNKEREESEEEVIDKDNLWKDNQKWSLPTDGKQEKIPFKIPTLGTGVYTVSVSVTYFPEDESLNPELSTWFYADDGSEEGFKLNTQSLRYEKDSIRKEMKLSNILRDSTITHFEGFILNHEPKDGDWQKRVEITSISIKFSPLPRLPDRRKGIIRVEKEDEKDQKVKDNNKLVPR